MVTFAGHRTRRFGSAHRFARTRVGKRLTRVRVVSSLVASTTEVKHMMRTVPFLVLFAAVSHDARAQAPPRFTSHHVIQFAPGTEPVRKLLSGDPSVSDLVAGNFEIAREDLNDDGAKEMILLAQESMLCGSGGCSLVVLELRGGKIATILNRGVAGTLAVTNEKVGGYRALAAVDDKGTIVLGDKAGTPLFRKQLVYPMEVAQAAAAAQAAQPRQTPTPTPGAPAACGSQPFCTETLTFAARITDVQAILQNTNTKTLTLRMSFRNKVNHPIILGYVSGSGIATDERGNRYAPGGQRAVQGIGLVQGNSGDAKFTLQPGESSDARFEFVWNTSGQEIFGVSFQVDLAIREIELIAGNQLRLGREHALHFSGLGNRTGMSPPRSTAPPAPPTIPGGAPAIPVPAAPQADACAGKPRCYSAGSFVAEIIGLTPSTIAYYSTPVDVLQARVRFRNLTNQPIILGYAAGSAVITDNFGNRYASTTPVNGDGAKGIGIVRDNQADPQFVLRPGASGDATFSLSRGRARTDRAGARFTLDLTIAQLEVLDGRQIRTVREYAVGVPNLTASGAGILNKLLQGLPKKNEHH